MKTILVPTDFSPCAENAFLYAAQIARRIPSRIVLLHVRQLQPAMTDAIQYLPDEYLDEMDRQAMVKLNELADKVLRPYQIPYELKCKMGFTMEVISQASREVKADLIVMGTRGARGIDKIFGTNAASVIGSASCPVLVIPEKASFCPVNKIVLAYDHGRLEPNTKISVLREMAQLFNAEVVVLSIGEPALMNHLRGEAEGVMLEQLLQGVKHSYQFLAGNDIEEAINRFARNQNAGMLTMIPRDHNLLSRIFKGSVTRQVAYQTQVPLLTIHG